MTLFKYLFRICFSAFVLTTSLQGQSMWVSGYYPGWTKDDMPPTAIDFNALTHLIQFSFMPDSNGSLNSDNGLTPNHCSATVAAAHSAGKKVLICIGGANTADGFRGACSSANRAGFIKNIIYELERYGYDGVDIDWEPLPSSDSVLYKALIRELRTAMEQIDTSYFLTVACCDDYWDPAVRNVFKDLQDEIDQINLMTYVMSGPWSGWCAWHGSALYSGTHGFPGDASRPLPSVDYWVDLWVNAGIAKKKIGIGIGFHAEIWSGISALYQTWSTEPGLQSDVNYTDMMRKYYTTERYNYDSIAEVPYLSIDLTDTVDDRFISYTNEQAIRKKIEYVAAEGLGGCIIWQLAQDYYGPGNSPLKRAVVQALAAVNATADLQEKIVRELVVFSNPFNSVVTISLGVHCTEPPRIAIYDVSGRVIADLSNNVVNNNCAWNAFGQSSGIFIVRAEFKDWKATKRITLIK